MNDVIIQSGTLATTHPAPTFLASNPTLSLPPNRVFRDASGTVDVKKLDNFIEAISTPIASHVSDALQSGLVFPWTQQVGTINVLNGRAQPSVNDDTDKIATFDLAQTDFEIEMEVFASTTAREGIVFRYVSAGVFGGLTLRGSAGINQLQLVTVNGGSTVLASYTDPAITGGVKHVLKLVSVGNVFTGFLNGVQRIGPTTIATNAGQTKAGMVLRASGANSGGINIQAR